MLRSTQRIGAGAGSSFRLIPGVARLGKMVWFILVLEGSSCKYLPVERGGEGAMRLRGIFFIFILMLFGIFDDRVGALP